MVSRVGWTAALGALLIQLLPQSHPSAKGQEYQGCFMINSAGRVVSLNRMCAPKAPAANNSPDLAFMEDYKRLAMDLPEETRKNLLQGIETSAPEKIATAKKICQDAKTGISLPELRLKTITEAQKMDSNSKQTFLADRDIIISLAPNYYCPEFRNL